MLDAQVPFSVDLVAQADRYASHCAEAGVATLLVVSTPCPHLGIEGGSAAPECAAHLSQAQAWALDRGFEHIEANCSDPTLGSAGREKFSIPRVLEALEATVWGSAVLHRPSVSRASVAVEGDSSSAHTIRQLAARHRAEEAEGAAGGPAEEEGEGEGEGEGDGEEAQHQGAGYVPPTLPASSEGGAAASGFALEQGEVGALKAALQSMAPSEGIADEASAAQFEMLLGQAISIRNAAKNGSVSDSARREAAAAMMEKLMAVLGVDEGEGEEEEEGAAAAAEEGDRK